MFEELLCYVLVMSKGSKLAYDHEKEEYVITLSREEKVYLPDGCEFHGKELFYKEIGKKLCRIEFE